MSVASLLNVRGAQAKGAGTLADANAELLSSVTTGQLEAVRDALRGGANIDTVTDIEQYEGVTALMLAIHFDHESIAKCLVTSGANLKRRSRSILPDERSNETALHWSIRKRRRMVCRLLIQRQSDIEACSSHGTPLLYAIEAGDTALARLLIDAKARIDEPAGGEKLLPIHAAAEAGNAAIIKLLLKSGARLVPNSLSGATPLMLAAQFERPKAVKLLLDAGDRIAATDKRGWTPLMHAAWCGNEECVVSILAFKPKLVTKNKTGESALDLARRIGNHAAAYWIEKAMARRR